MPTGEHYAIVAKDLRRRISGKDFQSIHCAEILDMLRETSGENNRLSEEVLSELEGALLKEHIRVFPHLKDATKLDGVVRVFGVRSAVAELMDALTRPSETTDVQLAEIIRKIGRKKSLLEVDDDFISRLESIFSQLKIEWIYEDGENLIEELKQRRLHEATKRRGNLIDEEFVKSIEKMREIFGESAGRRKSGDSVKIIREMREERDEQLHRVIHGDRE